MRKNPYPKFINCDEAMNALISEFSDDLDFQKERARQQLEDVLKVSPRLDTLWLRRSVDRVNQAGSLGELDAVLSEIVPHPAGKPIKFLSRNVRLLEGEIHFVHFTHAGLDINEFGFKGRQTPRKQVMTRIIEDVTIQDNGYIYAYPLHSYGEFKLAFRDYDGAVFGTASQVLAFDFIPDRELQYIIPVKCIDDYEFAYTEDLAYIARDLEDSIDSETLMGRSNPSREWFETQSLQNDENGYLINPDTNDIYWYHGSKYGGLIDGDVLYFSSDIDVARNLACIAFHPAFQGHTETAIIYKVKLKARADEIFDVRYADRSSEAKALAKKIEVEEPYNSLDKLHYGNFDYVLGYAAGELTYIQFAQIFGFKGWLEVENTANDPEPCTIGLFTNDGIYYEIVETFEVAVDDCEEVY